MFKVLKKIFGITIFLFFILGIIQQPNNSNLNFFNLKVFDNNTQVEIHSRIDNYNGVPTLFINNEPQPALAYMTYFQENNKYQSFVEAGYQLFSLPVYFSTRGINTLTNIESFEEGIFNVKGKPNFELFEKNIETILEQNPNAYILPRINISMPIWWEEENPTEVNLSNGMSIRESFYSQKWRDDAGKLLIELVEHINESAYRNHILGYQIACGNTEEWFHFDLKGGIGPAAETGFDQFIKELYPNEIGAYEGLPVFIDSNQTINTDLHSIRFLEFCSLAVADTISYFSSLVKETTQNQLIVGTFYGYGLEVYNPLYGTHALNYLLDDKNIDFFCSPNSYQMQRKSGIDWPDMIVTDSLKLHGKFYFSECDTRTALTKSINDSRSGVDLYGAYNSGLWYGPDTISESLSLIRKTFARQLIKGNGLWWFDMWGGWFEDKEIMDEMVKYSEITKIALEDKQRQSVADVAVFTDESVYKYLNPNSDKGSIVADARYPLGLTGVPYDIYDIKDFKFIFKNYKAIIFLTPILSNYTQEALKLANSNQIDTMIIDLQNPEVTVEQLRNFYKESNVHIWCETDDVVYVNENFIAIHAATPGIKTLRLKREREVKEILPNQTSSYTSNYITVEMNQYDTILFRLDN